MHYAVRTRFRVRCPYYLPNNNELQLSVSQPFSICDPIFSLNFHRTPLSYNNRVQ